MIFLRHPTPSAPKGLCYGRLEVGLSVVAADEIRATVPRVPEGRPILSSPARRCHALARALGPVQYDARLLEMHFGAWEGQLWDAIPRRQSDPWAANPWDVAPPGGERFKDLMARVEAALDTAPPDAIIVTHAGVIRAARMLVAGESFETVFAVAVPYATPVPLGETP